MRKFKKTILKVGKYESPDGTINVTPERLRHWEKQFVKFSSNGNVAASHWDHDEVDPKNQLPITVEEFRSSKSAVGRMVDFTVLPGGQQAEMTVELKDPLAIRKAKSNSVFLSPVIFNQWKDGKGTKYEDIITAVDVVTNPVDSSQGPFEPVASADSPAVLGIRMGLKIYRMSEKPMADEDKDDDKDEKKPPKKEESSDGEGEGDGEDTVDDGGKLKEVKNLLKTCGIVVSDDTDGSNFIDHLHQALLTYQAQTGEGGMDDFSEDQDLPQVGSTTEAGVENGMMMSVVRKYYDKDISTRIESLVKTGRCTPKEAKDKLESLKVVKLSLNDQGEPKKNSISAWVDDREQLPEGAVWDAKTRTRMSSRSAAEPDSRKTMDGGNAETVEDAQRVVKELFQRA